MRALCALYVLERLLHVVTHPRLVNFLAAALLLGAVQPRRRASAPAPASVAAAQRGDAGEDAAEVPGPVVDILLRGVLCFLSAVSVWAG